MDATQLKHTIEAALMASGRPLSADQLLALFDGRLNLGRGVIREAIAELQKDYEDRGIVIAEVASGYRLQIRPAMCEALGKLWEDRPPRYSRALLETLALIAYRQPITRGEIENVRGVAVSTNIMRTLLERGWVRVVGHREVPGRPAMFATTREFLDYFGLKRLEDLPPLAEIGNIDGLTAELDLGLPAVEADPQPEANAEGEGDAESPLWNESFDAAAQPNVVPLK